MSKCYLGQLLKLRKTMRICLVSRLLIQGMKLLRFSRILVQTITRTVSQTLLPPKKEVNFLLMATKQSLLNLQLQLIFSNNKKVKLNSTFQAWWHIKKTATAIQIHSTVLLRSINLMGIWTSHTEESIIELSLQVQEQCIIHSLALLQILWDLLLSPPPLPDKSTMLEQHHYLHRMGFNKLQHINPPLVLQLFQKPVLNPISLRVQMSQSIKKIVNFKCKRLENPSHQ